MMKSRSKPNYKELAYDAMHRASLSDDEHEAAFGRAMKAFVGTSDLFDEAEEERGTSRCVAAMEQIHAMFVISIATALAGAKEGRQRDMLKSVQDIFDHVMEAHIDMLDQRNVNSMND